MYSSREPLAENSYDRVRVIINNIFPPDQLPILEPQDFQERRTTQFWLTQDGSKIVALGARVHIFVQPALKDEFVWLFADVLACNVIEHDFGLTYPILFVGFPSGTWTDFNVPNYRCRLYGAVNLRNSLFFRGRHHAWLRRYHSMVSRSPWTKSTRGRHPRARALLQSIA